MNLEEEVKKALKKYPKEVLEYKNGKTTLIGLFCGEVMVQTRNTCDKEELVKLLKKLI